MGNSMNPSQWNILSRLLFMVRQTFRVFLSRQTPLYVKLVLGLGIAYALSPYDIIPEWVPVVGVLDDIALAALLVAWAQRFSPPEE